MRGDFSRLTFRPENHFSGVLLQQGRVQLDAEFNEHVAIEAHRDKQTTRDVIGRAGAPLDGGGFEVSVASMLRGVAAGEHAWAVGDDDAILRSEGGAKRWRIEERQAAARRLNAVALGRSDTGWAVGDRSMLLRLEGTAWKRDRAPRGVTADLHGVHAEKDSAWAVGTGGTVIAWDGSEWHRQARDADAAATLRDVHFAGTVGVAVGDGGTILFTEDGERWKLQDAPAGTGDLHGVHLADAQHGWAVGEQGTILSFDGEQWTEQPPAAGVRQTLRAVVMTSATAGMAVGDGGVAVRLQDRAWTPAPTGVAADLRAVAEIKDGALIAVGDDVAITWKDDDWTAAPDMPAGPDGPQGRTLTLSAGDIYVDGVRYENERVTSLDDQPEPALDLLPEADGSFGVVLHVQEQLLTATEREELREVALGGPDSATRTRSVWQARLAALRAGEQTCSDLAAGVPVDGPRGLLRARAVPAAVAASECIVPPNGGYRRLENQLYRVEIHTGSTHASGATYLWSRENGSVIARLEHVSAAAGTMTGDVRVSHIGRDAALGFGPEQLVEITDARRMLRGEPGVLAEIDEIRGTTLILSKLSEAPLTMADFPVDPIVRRWDGTGTVQLGTWLDLEDGVSVQFAEGADTADPFRSGDYWTIPARTLSGRVEWPETGGVPRFEDRHGPRREHAPLAVASRDKGVWHGVRDCRRLFPPLTGLVHLYYAGGDGQEIAPPMPLSAGNLVALDAPLAAGVVNGSTPVTGGLVEFAVDAGAGRVGGGDQTSVRVPTDENGIATCPWRLDGQMRTQAVTARLVDDLEQAPPQVIRYTAQLSVAEWVGYDGSRCPTLAGAQTVQGAIEAATHLAHVAALSGSGEDVRPDEAVEIAVVVTTDCSPVKGATVVFKNGARGTGTIAPGSATTDGEGIATCTWTPDPKTPTQDLTATLDSVPAPAIRHRPDQVRFVANINLANDTAYTPPERCPEMKGTTTVQEAIDRLLALLPRLYHVAGDGQHAPPAGKIRLQAGIANRCGIRDLRVRFERLDHGGDGREEWTLLALVEPEAEIATHEYVLDDLPRRQLLRARLAESDRPVGDPVYFAVSVLEAGEPGEPGDREHPAVKVLARKQEIEPGVATIMRFEDAEFGADLFEPPSMLIVKRAGLYLATGEIEWSAAADNGVRGFEITRNDERLARVQGPNSRTAPIAHHATAVARFEDGDRVQLSAFQGGGAGVLADVATMSLAWLSA